MPTTTGFVPHDGSTAGEGPVRPGDDGTAHGPTADRPTAGAPSIEVLADGSVLAARPAPTSAQLYVSPQPGGVAWGTDLGDLVADLRERGAEIAPHGGTVLAYLRGDDVASAPTTFYAGILRLRAGDEIRIAPDGSVTRTRPQSAPAAAGGSLDDAVRAALAGDGGAAVVMGEDIASAALLAQAPDPTDAVRVRAGSVRAQDSTSGTDGASRAQVAIDAAGTSGQTVHPTTDRFKKDLADLVRAQAEPFAGLGVYAHYCALREIARAHGDGAAPRVLDASGPVGAGLISSSSSRPSIEGSRGLVAAVRERLRARGRRILQADAVLAPDFVQTTPATGHLPAAPGSGRDTAAVVAASRNAARFGLPLDMPLLEAPVSAALAVAVQREQATGEDTGGRHRRHLGARRSAGDIGSTSPRQAEALLAPFAPLAAPAAAATRPSRLAAIDQGEWLSRLKGTLYQVFRSPEFAGRPWVDQRAVLEAFEAHVAGRTVGGDDLFWRLLNLELWMRECVDGQGAGAEAILADEQDADGGDDHGAHDEPDPKAPLEANPGKQLDLEIDGRSGRVTARRYPLQTGKFSASSDMDAEVAAAVGGFFAALDAELDAAGPDSAEHREATVGRPWNLTISEKIIAIMQGRSYFVWDIEPGRPARVLSRYVARTPAGIGLGDPVTMQLAIQEAGLPRVLAAAAAGAVGKAIGRKGLFYEVVGGNVRAIDGPTEYSVYPANVSAKLPPKDPDAVAEHLNAVVRATVPPAWRDTFTGTVVMDANDIGRNTLGKSAPESGEHYELQFADNPLGQGREQTPMAIVFER